MSTLVLNIRMEGKVAAVFGGGAVAARKIRTLLTAGSQVRVVATVLCSEIEALKGSGLIDAECRRYSETDLDNVFLAVAATDEAQVNRRIASDARERGILVAVADDPTAGDCSFPAVLQRGRLEIAVSTGGRCPSFAADVRDCIAVLISPECGDIVDILAEEREKLLTNGSSSTYNADVLHSLGRQLLAGLTERKESLP